MVKINAFKTIIKEELHLKSFRGILLDFVPIGLDGKTWPIGTVEDSVGRLDHNLKLVIDYLNLHTVNKIDIIKIANKGTFRLRLTTLYKKDLLQRIRNLNIDKLNG